MTQLIVGAASAAVGFAIGGPVGAQIGWAVGTMLAAPTQKTQGPRLSDLKVTGAEYGQPIPWGAGHPRIAGQIWWSSERREIATTTEQGKGGGVESTTYTYEVDLLIGLTDNVIGGVSRVFDNGKLVYTKLAQSGAESALSSKAQSKWRRMTVYTGAANQLPDPTYEQALGVGNAPAYRDRGTVFIEGLQLGNSGQIPNLTFEVYTQGDDVGDTVTTLVPQFEGTTSFGRGAVAFSSPSFTFHFGQTSNVDVFRFTLGQEDVEIVNSYSLIVGGFAPYWLNSDVSGQVICNTGSTTMHVYDDDGIGVTFTLPYTAITQGGNIVYARRGSAIVVGSALQGGSNTLRLYRFPTTGGAASVTGAVMAQPVRSITIAGSLVYAVNAPGATATASAVYVLDMATLSLQATLSVPAELTNYLYNDIVTDESDNVFLIGSDKVWRLDGTNWTVVKNYTGGTLTSGQLASRVGVFNGDLYSISYFNPNNRLSVVFEAVDLTEPTLQSVVEELCDRANMPAGTYDATALASITRPVRAIAVGQVTPVRTVLEQLAGAFFFECYATDKLYFVPRGGSNALTVDADDMGAGEEQAAELPLVVRIASDEQIPAQIALSYPNVDADYNTATEHSDRLLSGIVDTRVASIPLGMQATEAKGVVDAMLTDAYAGRISGEVSLPLAYTRLTPTDVIPLTDRDGTQYRGRIVRRQDRGVLCTFEWVLDDVTALQSAGITSDDYAPSLTVQLPGPTTISLMDIPILRDADDSPGIYVAAKPTTPVWPGYQLNTSIDGGTEYSAVGTGTSRAVFGLVTVALTNYTGGNVFDEAGGVTVDVGAGTLSSASRDDVLNTDANAMLVGSEIIQFRIATFVSSGIYRLTGLLRGRRGTEWAMTGHTIGERAVLLRPAGLLRVSYDAARIGLAALYKGVTLGKTLSSASARSITDTGIALKPFAPANLRANTSTPGLYQITWDRRSRLSYRWPSASDLPVGESAQSYAVELLNVSNVVVETQTVAASAATFSTATRTMVLEEGIGYLAKIGSSYYGIQTEGSGVRYVLEIGAAGSVQATSFALGDRSWAMVANAGQLFATGDVFSSGTPQTILSSTIYRLDPSNLSAVAASYAMPTNGDAHGIWHDGSSLWVPGYISGDLRELDGTTLASVGATAIEAGMWGIAGDGTYLYITNIDTGDVFAHEPGVGEFWRAAAVGLSPNHAMVRDGHVFVACADKVAVLDATDGSPVASHTATITGAAGVAPLVSFGAYVAFRRTSGYVAFINATTGAIDFESFIPAITYLAGADGATLFTIASPTLDFNNYETWGYELNSDLSGFKVRVYQISATVGRGYPATLTL